MAEPRRSCGPMLLCRRIGRPLPGVPPGDDAHDGAMRIFGVIRVLSDNRRFGNEFATRRKLLSGDDGELPNHQPPRTPEPVVEMSKHRNKHIYNLESAVFSIVLVFYVIIIIIFFLCFLVFVCYSFCWIQTDAIYTLTCYRCCLVFGSFFVHLLLLRYYPIKIPH